MKTLIHGIYSSAISRTCRLPQREMVWIPGGEFLMGSDHHYPDERPAHAVHVDGFWIDCRTVTNRDFARFVEATGYKTLAERWKVSDASNEDEQLDPPSSLVFQKPTRRFHTRDPARWWILMRDADWRHPRGPESSIIGIENHPVVHIAYEDAEAYAAWEGKELPTEAEWEFAARGDLECAEFAWGSEFMPEGRFMANTWQGEFPWENRADDGYEWTSPVGFFPSNGYGLYDMAGNVWQWTCDWYQPHHRAAAKDWRVIHNPRSDGWEAGAAPRLSQLDAPRKVIKGGSFLSAPRYCGRYRPAARIAQPIDASACHLGFRCVVRGRGHH